MAKSKSKRQASPMSLFDAQLSVDALQALFENIKVQVIHSQEKRDEEAYRTAIEAIAEMGVRECQEIQSRIEGARHA